MNDRLQINDENDPLKESKNSATLNKITTKSNNIKAMMKFKYLIYKLERTCSLKRFI